MIRSYVLTISRLVKLSLVLSTAVATQTAWCVTVDSVRLWRAPDHTRIVFDLSDTVEHKVFQLKEPYRLVVDVNGTALIASLSHLNLDNTDS